MAAASAGAAYPARRLPSVEIDSAAAAGFHQVRREPKACTIGIRRRWVFSSSRRTAIANAVPSVVASGSRALFSLFFPDDCRICGLPLREVRRYPVCAECLAATEPLSAEFFCVSCRTPFRNAFPLDFEGRCGLCRAGLRGFDAAYCFGAYEAALRDLIHIYKYARVRTLARPLADLLMRALPRDERLDLVASVPLHWTRQWERGFNQSELLAREVARRCGLPFARPLRRARATTPQAGLSNTARRRNVAAAFRPARFFPPERLEGKRLLLIDDVMTTGSTAAACALALKRAGAARVALLTLARVDRRMDGQRPLKAARAAVGVKDSNG